MNEAQVGDLGYDNSWLAGKVNSLRYVEEEPGAEP